MRMFILVVSVLFFYSPLFAVEEAIEELELNVTGPEGKKETDLKDAPPLGDLISGAASSDESSVFDASSAPTLKTALRIDVAYAGGKPIQQGFSLPSLRFGATGTLGKNADYNLQLGQTREFSSALAPQILPVEAWVQLRDEAGGWDSKSQFSLRLGMFTPALNPQWTPDIGDLPLPDYYLTHNAMLINRDLGVQLTYRPVAGRVVTALALSNGAGIVSLNTNNSTTISAYVGSLFPIGSLQLELGAAGYTKTQSDSTSVNYISNTAANIFSRLNLKFMSIGFSFLVGTFKDSSRTLNAWGSTADIFVPVSSRVTALVRWETARNSPETNAGIDHWQLGPIVKVSENLKAFLFYEYLDSHLTSSIENSGQLRLRLKL